MKRAEAPISASTILFRSELHETETGGAYLSLPKEVGGKLPVRGKTMVEGTIGGFPFRSEIESDSKRGPLIKFNNAVFDAVGAGAAEIVTVEITRVEDEAEIRTPADLSKALSVVPKAAAQWAQITPMARRDWVLWISSGKQEETRKVRIKKACSMLASGKRRVCCFGGLNWLTKDHRSIDTWLPLPAATK